MTITNCPKGHVRSMHPNGYCDDCDHYYSPIPVTVSGPVAAAPMYGEYAIVVLLDRPPSRKFRAGETVTVSTVPED